MIDHLGFPVTDLEQSRAFYEKALAPLGISVLMEVTEEQTGGHGAHLGFGRDNNPAFWISTGKPAVTGVHLAFSAPDAATVDAFYNAAIAAGARDNGKPGPRPDYHPGYYGAFVIDLDGNNIEAVCHTWKPA